MKSEWQCVNLADVTSKLGDGLHGTPVYDENGEYYFINGNNLSNGRITIKPDTKRVSKTEHQKYKVDLNNSSILVSINGTIGNIAKYKDERCILGKSACYFNCNNTVDRDFLYYIVLNNHFQNYISRLATGTTIKNVSLKTMREYEFFLPPLEEQKAIASVLSALDGKIANNTQINHHLEQIAHAFFKSWFVDFEPWNGEQPFDWTETQFGEISTVQNGFAFKSEDYCNDGCRMIRTTNIENGFVNNNDLINLPKAFYTDRKYQDFVFKCFDTVLVMVGASVGKTGLITRKNVPSLQNQNMWRFRPLKDNISSVFIHYYTKLINESVRGWSSGSARDFYRKDIFKKAPCLLPSDSVMLDFNSKTLPLFERISQNLEENEKLVDLRDSLLPKLMSGELSI